MDPVDALRAEVREAINDPILDDPTDTQLWAAADAVVAIIVRREEATRQRLVDATTALERIEAGATKFGFEWREARRALAAVAPAPPTATCEVCEGTGIEPLPANTWSHAHDLRACRACGGRSRPVAAATDRPALRPSTHPADIFARESVALAPRRMQPNAVGHDSYHHVEHDEFFECWEDRPACVPVAAAPPTEPTGHLIDTTRTKATTHLARPVAPLPAAGPEGTSDGN